MFLWRGYGLFSYDMPLRVVTDNVESIKPATAGGLGLLTHAVYHTIMQIAIRKATVLHRTYDLTHRNTARPKGGGRYDYIG